MTIPLYDVYEGAIGTIFWMEKTNHIVSDEDTFKIRQKAIADSINSAIQNAIYNGNHGDVQIAMQKGWNSANQQVEMIENGTEMKSATVMIGISNLLDVISDIENSPKFRGWVNPHIIKEIKEHYNNITN